jgi:hypothetical protein
MRFSSFLDKKHREARRQLGILGNVLKEAGMKVKESLKESDPHIFLRNPGEDLDFEGVRIYKIGSDLAYRIQNEEGTQPYGAAYPLNLEELFEDLIADMEEKKAADKVKDAVVEEFKNFFKRSAEAQEKMNSDGPDSTSKIIVSAGNGDISNSM